MVIVKTPLKCIPENCTTCKYSVLSNKTLICTLETKTPECVTYYGNVRYIAKRPEWCPLCELPESDWNTFVESVK